ncbi:MAG TPA: hypothetical protein VEI02_11475, partial [Planctomycetota bacterium]|nr:hypothetical protein [Planctomycetota bacterium]
MSSKFRRAAAPLAVAALLASSLVAQSTLGDDCSNPDVTTVGPGVYPYDSTGFTVTGPISGCNGLTDVFDYWFTYTATMSGIAVVSNCSTSTVAPGGFTTAGVDTYIGIWDTTSCPPTTEIACADGSPNCGVNQSEVLFGISAGNTYYIQVGNWIGGSPVSGAIAIVELPGAANDECAGAIPLTTGLNTGFNNFTATPSLPNPSCGIAGPDVWFTFTPTCTGNLIIETCGSPLDTVVTVWDNCPGVEVACNDDAGAGPCAGTLQSYINFPATVGNTYYIQVGGWAGATGNFDINIHCEYVHVWSAPFGSGSLQLENVDGPPGAVAYSAITLDILHVGLPAAVTFPNGWFFGVPMGFVELTTQLGFGG